MANTIPDIGRQHGTRWYETLTEVDVGLASASAADPGGSCDGAALLERDELVEVVEIGEHSICKAKRESGPSFALSCRIA